MNLKCVSLLRAVAWTALILVIIMIISVMWYYGRKLHYSMAYEHMVRQTVKEMVKQEALK